MHNLTFAKSIVSITNYQRRPKGVNMPKYSFKDRLLDARPDRLDLRDREYLPPLKSLPAAWPLKEDLERLFQRYRDCKMVLDQKNEGACTGFGLAAVINYLIWRDLIKADDKSVTAAVMKEVKVSPSMLYNMAKIYDEWSGEDYEGSSCRGAMKGWHRHGVCTLKSWPFKPGKKVKPKEGWAKEAVFNPLGAYYRVNKDSIVDMQSAIVEVGAIYCSATIHEGWWIENCTKLPVIKQSKTKAGGHAFAIVGYTEDGFIVQNSWGESWGYLGFGVLSYSDWVENGTDAWVVVRGAKVNVSKSPITFSHNSLQTIGADYTKVENSPIAKALRYDYINKEVMPWSEEKAYLHSLVIGNDGRAKRTVISAPTVEDSVKEICYERIKKWMQKSRKNRKVVIYAHGGLNSEQDSINRVRIMAPYFKANGLYPLFITWKTGFLESIENEIKDKIENIFLSAGISPSSAKAKGILDMMQESLDRAIEIFANKVVIKGVWSEMKENAKLASDKAVPGYAQHGKTKAGGMVLLAKALKRLQSEFDIEIHLVGHSAGSILLGHWLDILAEEEMKAQTFTLYAPACTLAFANGHYIKAYTKGVIKQNKTYIHIMDDQMERADNVAIYKKSLLYLISRALEEVHKTPLLGMEAAWNLEYSREHDIFNQAQYSHIKRWSSFAKDINLSIYDKRESRVKTSLKGDYIKLSHGSFDNNIEIIESTIKEILGKKKLKYIVENLTGY